MLTLRMIKTELETQVHLWLFVLYQQGKTDEAKELKASVPSLKKQLEAKEKEFKEIEVRRLQLLLMIPNLPDDDCPDGFSENSNVVLNILSFEAPHSEKFTNPYPNF